MDDLLEWLRAQLDEDQRIAREAAMAIGRTGYENGVLVDPPARFGDDLAADGAQWAPSYHKVMRKRLKPDEKRRTVAECGGFGARPVADHVAAHDPARVLREIDAKRQLLTLHAPEWAVVEWAHDQNGKGEAQVCRSCGNRDLDSWLNWRRLGDGDLPEGVKPPYVVAPCPTVRLLALPYADREGYLDSWRP
jgi:hypothetical protein